MTFIKITYFIFKGLTVLHYRNKNKSLVGIDTESHNGALCINQGFFLTFPMALLFFQTSSFPILSSQSQRILGILYEVKLQHHMWTSCSPFCDVIQGGAREPSVFGIIRKSLVFCCKKNLLVEQHL
jgi:hypothetical protein